MSAQHWQPIDISKVFLPDLHTWLAGQMTEEMPWLLVHADDGVIWGRREANGELTLSSNVSAITSRYPSIAVPLRIETLQQARIFGPAGELLIWRTVTGFSGRRIMDDQGVPADTWDEPHLLWGTRVMEAEKFTVLEERRQGPVHAVPFPAPARQRAALTVRHYVAPEEFDQATVTMSRLVQVGLAPAQAGG